VQQNQQGNCEKLSNSHQDILKQFSPSILLIIRIGNQGYAGTMYPESSRWQCLLAGHQNGYIRTVINPENLAPLSATIVQIDANASLSQCLTWRSRIFWFRNLSLSP